MDSKIAYDGGIKIFSNKICGEIFPIFFSRI
nr:MAG TPA: hypothetical protein [Bacteriophage sp.]